MKNGGKNKSGAFIILFSVGTSYDLPQKMYIVVATNILHFLTIQYSLKNAQSRRWIKYALGLVCS